MEKETRGTRLCCSLLGPLTDAERVLHVSSRSPDPEEAGFCPLGLMMTDELGFP
jgi:hypothetical protein